MIVIWEGALALYSMWDGYVTDRFKDTLKMARIVNEFVASQIKDRDISCKALMMRLI
jgi:hypothetical protein